MIPGLTVCLRCQIRLGQRPIPSLLCRTISTRSAAADDSSSTQADDTSSTQADDTSSAQADDQLGTQSERVSKPFSRSNAWDPEENFTSQTHKRKNYRTLPRSAGWKRPLGRLLGGKENGQWETSEALDVKSLGKNAEVIVLRDAKFTSFLSEKKNTEVAQPPVNIDILEKLQSERGIVSNNEIFSNINDFRPATEGNSVSWANLIDLVQVMEGGFTYGQMRQYLRAFEGRTKILPSLAPDLINTNGIVRVSAWVPETFGPTELLKESPLIGYSTPSFTSKQISALEIIRQCWKVGVPEIEEGIGQAEVQFNPAELELLVKQGFLKSISANYIFSKVEKIEVFRKRDVVRITSNREKAALIVAEIEDALRHISRTSLLLRPIFPKTKDKKLEKRHSSELILRTIGQLTNTEIEKSDYKGQPQASHSTHPHSYISLMKSQVIISNIEFDAPTQTSTKHEVARRLLLSSSPLADRESLRIEYKAPLEDQKGAFIKQEGLKGLPWHQRMQKWHRWTVPIAKEEADDQTSKKPKQDSLNAKKRSNETPQASKDQSPAQSTILAHHDAPIRDSDEMQDITSGSRQRSPTSKTDEVEASWDTEVAWSGDGSIETSAVAGRVLHGFTSDNTFVPRELSATSRPEVLHTFSSDISSIFRALRDAPLLTFRPFETLIMRFKPNPWAEQTDGGLIGAKALTAFPLIEMRFSINFKYRQAKLRDVRAITSADTSDLMLPQSKYDLRFQHRVSSYMIPFHGPLEDRQFSPSIESFVGKCNLDLASDRPLETPASLIIPMADHICSPGARSLIDPQGRFEGHKLFPVDYLFAGLEYRNTMAFDFDGWETTYTTIEGGKAGGSGSELRLLPIRTDQQPAYEEEFMQSAYKLVDIVGSNTVLVARVPDKAEKDIVGLSFSSNTARRHGRFKFWPYRPSEIYDKRTVGRNDQEWQRKLKGELATNEDGTAKVEETTSAKEHEEEDEGK
ncbi:respiratory complex assembly rmp1 protein [Rutstroemia sp. NJR-2017a BVV2]|nr:respiratory complex assembly rmp1 protein [Rutstroemia sp. NJR-2017a BVV2]